MTPYWLHKALDPIVVRRSIKYSIGVGLLLVAINHGEAILAGDIDTLRLAQMVLTLLVPYGVSTASSVAAMGPVHRPARDWSKEDAP